MTPPQRIGVLTFHRCINYGSYWQARCLVEGLRERGLDAVLLNHTSSRIDRIEWRCALHPIPGTMTAHRSRYAAKIRNFLAASAELTTSEPFPLEAPQQSEAFDLVIVGSDEVWNLRHPWYGGKSLFYGDGIAATRLASYAASFGNQSSDSGLDPYWSARLGQFHTISVRDQNSQNIVASAGLSRPRLVLDPCLQFAHLIPKTGNPEGMRYAAVYGHDFPDWLIGEVTRWAQRTDTRLISIGYDNPWADEQRIEAGPLEYATLMAGASAVITTFFHGCVFALINDKPFVTATSDYRANKILDLVAVLGAERHLAGERTTADDYNDILAAPLDARIGERIAALRRSSEAYLDEVLA